MKRIIITGTSRGIGYELVKLFAKEGHQILALSRNEHPCRNLGLQNVTAFTFDITNATHFDKVKDFIESDWEGVDILINNAGQLLSKPFAETTMEAFEAVYKVNVFGVAELTRIVLPYMSKGGHVVAISSMGGVQGSVKFPGLSAYSSSKGAVITLTELLAEEYKESGIAFNVLAIGAVQTEMLAEAFPGYEAPVTALQMGKYIQEFALTGQQFYNGKLMQVSSSTP